MDSDDSLIGNGQAIYGTQTQSGRRAGEEEDAGWELRPLPSSGSSTESREGEEDEEMEEEEEVLEEGEGDNNITEEEKSILLGRKNQKGEVITPTEQTNEERCQIRRELDKIKETLREVLDGTEVMEPHEVEAYIQRCNQIYDKIQFAREGAQDQELMAMASEICKKMAQTLETSHRKFDPAEFAEKIRIFYTGKAPTQKNGGSDVASDSDSSDSDGSIDIEGRRLKSKRVEGMAIKREEWAAVGRLAWSMLRECPTIGYIYGSFDPDEAAVRERQKKERLKRQADAPLKQLGKQTADPAADSAEKTMMRVDKLFRQLRKHCITNGPDGRVKMELDNKNLPILTIVEEVKGAPKDGNQSVENKQCIMGITMLQWEELVKVYGIREPFIKPEYE